MFPPVIPPPARAIREKNVALGTASKTVTGTLASSTTITALGSMSGVAIGAHMVHADIPVSSVVVAIDDAAHTATISVAATGSVVGTPIVFVSAIENALQGLNVHLFQVGLTPTPTTPLATFTANEATFDGYAAIALALTQTYIDAGGNAIAQSQLLDWVPTGSTTPNSIAGFWVDDGTNVLAYCVFSNPAGLNGPTTELSFVFIDSFPPGVVPISVIPSNT